MVLIDKEIKEAIAKGEIIISPYDEKLVSPASLDFRLGNVFTKVKSTGGPVDPLNPSTFTTEIIKANTYNLRPGEFILAAMFETVTLPNNIAAEIKGKSSLARLGLFNSEGLGGFVDPGWRGTLILELYNCSSYSIKLTYGMKIGQLILHRTNQAEKDYTETGRYVGQTAEEGGSKGIDAVYPMFDKETNKLTGLIVGGDSVVVGINEEILPSVGVKAKKNGKSKTNPES